mmetsp:Transcript_111753/g.279921  ORF Transcript_111753/g.279921 Transcript_111753/m.279921 type:complete len:229 (+) Transcript_111753:1671-2357(+)
MSSTEDSLPSRMALSLTTSAITTSALSAGADAGRGALLLLPEASAGVCEGMAFACPVRGRFLKGGISTNVGLAPSWVGATSTSVLFIDSWPPAPRRLAKSSICSCEGAGGSSKFSAQSMPSLARIFSPSCNFKCSGSATGAAKFSPTGTSGIRVPSIPPCAVTSPVPGSILVSVLVSALVTNPSWASIAESSRSNAASHRHRNSSMTAACRKIPSERILCNVPSMTRA